MPRYLYLLLSSGVLLGPMPALVQAHDLPFGSALPVDPAAAGGSPLVVTNRGLVVHSSEGWRVRCNEAYGVNAVAEVAALQHSAASSILLARNSGVLRSTDGGCTFEDVSPVPEVMSAAKLSAFLTPAAQPERMWVATGNEGEGNALFFSDDFGDSWTRVFDNPGAEWFSALAVAPSEPERMYATLSSFDEEEMLLETLWGSSSDGGNEWQTRNPEQELQLVGVHPENALIVFAQETLDDLGRTQLWRSTDGGESFTPSVEGISPFTDLITGPDGTLWLGGKLDAGLYISSDDGATFELDSQWGINGVDCLHNLDGQIWMCANRLPNVDGIWRFDEAAGDWEKVLTFDQVTAPVQCDEQDQLVCDDPSRTDDPWDDWTEELLGGSVMADAGPSGADAGSSGADAGAQPVDASTGGNVDTGTSPPPVDAGGFPPRPPPGGGSGCNACSAAPRTSHLESWRFAWGYLFVGLLVLRRARRAHLSCTLGPKRL